MIPFLGVVLLVLALAPAASATSGTMVITEDTTLTEDHDGSIVIDADDITLDCAGFTVSGPDLERGISVDGHSGVTVKNCLVTGFFHGIVVLDGSSNALRANSTYSNTGSGVVVDADDTTLVGNRVSDNADNGFEVYFCSGNTFKDNVATGSGDAGFVLQDCPYTRFVQNVARGNGAGFVVMDSRDIRLIENTARGNDDYGLGVFTSSHVVLRGDTARGNGGNGFEVWRSDRNVLADNASIANGADGFWLWRAERNAFTGNTARVNGIGLGMQKSSGNVFKSNKFIDSGPDGWGVWVADSSNHNRFVHNVARKNDYEGFAIVGSSGNELIRNISNGSDYQGISLYFGAEYNVVRANVTRGNAGSGVDVIQSSHNSIVDNRSMNNNPSKQTYQGGISVLEGSSFNEILRNVACNNGNVDGYDDRSGTGNVWRANRFCSSDI